MMSAWNLRKQYAMPGRSWTTTPSPRFSERKFNFSVPILCGPEYRIQFESYTEPQFRTTGPAGVADRLGGVDRDPHRPPSGEAFPPPTRTTCERALGLLHSDGEPLTLGAAAPENPCRGQGDGQQYGYRVAGSFGRMPDSGAASTCRSATQPNTWRRGLIALHSGRCSRYTRGPRASVPPGSPASAPDLTAPRWEAARGTRGRRRQADGQHYDYR